MLTLPISIFQTYVADTPVDVHYITIKIDNIKGEKEIVYHITKIMVPADNRPLYKTRTRELNEAIVELIKKDKADAKAENDKLQNKLQNKLQEPQMQNTIHKEKGESTIL